MGYWSVAVVGDWAMSVRLAFQVSQIYAHAQPPCFPRVLFDFEVPVWHFFSSAPSEMLAWGKTIGCPGRKNSQMLATIY